MAIWDGGGNIPPELGVARRLVDRGHTVHVLSDPTVQAAAEAAGCGHTSWRRAPHRTSLDPSDDLLADWETNNPLVLLRRLRDRFIAGPAADFAADTAAAIEAFQPDLVVPDAFLFGSIIAAQGARLPVALLLPNIWVMPTRGTPPIGPGFLPAKTVLGRTRDSAMVATINWLFRSGLPPLNEARAAYGLPPFRSFYDHALNVDRILVLSSAAFDYASPFVPANVRYVGPVLDEPAWSGEWTPPWPDGNDDPVVLVGLSSTYQNQGPVLEQVAEALRGLPVRGVITLGRAIDPGTLASTERVAVVPSAPHSKILEETSLVVTHCGHGTTMRALTAGVPIVGIPMGRDQNDTAARVVHHGVGIRLSPNAPAHKIRGAVRHTLDDPSYRISAARLGAAIRDEQASADIVGELEALVP